MKSLLFTLILITCVISANSQGLQSDHQWSFGLEIFPNSTFEIITSEDGSDKDVETFLQRTEEPKFCLSGQAFVSYKLTSKSFLSLGIGYQNTGYQTTKLPISYTIGVDPRVGFVAEDPNDPSLPTDIEITYNHHSIQFPLFYKYNFGKKFFVRGGLSYIITVANTSNADLYFASGDKQKEDYLFDNSTYNNMNLSGNAGFGYTYYETGSTNLYVQFNFERFFYKISTNGTTNRTPVSTGLILGAKF